ncbi:AraC-like ligand-binding domain-containing protein [Streptomyces pratensis]|uniref:AraC-like ligand-binding domain-containing protein n=1 Tax=Streptomyces pratensis TaxID=1169025 RepID=UPI00362A9F8D
MVCLMSPVLDTAFIPPRDREDVVRNAVWQSMVAVDIDHRPAAEDISVRIGLGAVGPIRICSARATAVTLRRTERLARQDDEPAVTLGVQMTGSSVVVQKGRVPRDRPQTLGPGPERFVQRTCQACCGFRRLMWMWSSSTGTEPMQACLPGDHEVASP